MNAAAPPDWTEANQRLLVAEFASLRAHLGDCDVDGDGAGPGAARAAAPDALPEPAAIDRLTRAFGLSAFERQVLLLAAGVEMDGALARLVPRLTFGLALASLPDAHWSAIGPLAPLRGWRLVELDDASPTQGRLRIDERVLHFLAGVNRIDARLAPLLQRRDAAAPMAEGQRATAACLVAQLSRTVHSTGGEPTPIVVQLAGDDAEGQRDVAAAVAEGLQCSLYVLSQADLPSAPADLASLATLWARETVLGSAALLIDADIREGADGTALARLVARLQGLVFIGSRDGVPVASTWRAQVDRPHAAEQRDLWSRALSLCRTGAWPSAAATSAATTCAHRLAERPVDDDLPDSVRDIASQFRLSAAAVRAQAPVWWAAAGAGEHDSADGRSGWRHCLARTRPGMDALAQLIDPVARWDDLVLPAAQQAALRQLAAQIRLRAQVHEDWGFAGQGSRGLGISALFSGESGVGKTTACEVLARELDLDLYRIDLSGVVSKYIGETEKNLRRVFDAAEESGAVLLFDEADALFGKRSEVKDSHDRYANIEVGYLLQRMETYRGLSVLTTNQRAALDPSFLRRLRFVVHFPFPDQAQREAIWRRVFPAAMPQQGIDPARLAQLQVPGGHIRNIALSAAFLAADAGTPVTMSHLARAAQQEAAKHERPLAEHQTRGWA